MYEDTLRRHLDEIIDNLGVEDPDVVRKYKNFKLEISDKNLRSRNGAYFPKEMKIQITRHSQARNANNVKTALHELAHHLDHCDRNHSAHDKEFYRQYRRLLYSALDLGKISLDEMMEMAHTSSDYNKVMKILNEYVPNDPIIKQNEEFMYELNVSGIEETDPRLIAYGYKYNQRRKTWFRKVLPESVDFEKDVLNSLGVTEFQLKDANTIQMLDDEAEYMRYEHELKERKENIIKRSQVEYRQLSNYISKMVANGFDFDALHDNLSGFSVVQENGEESFRFRYITLVGTIIGKENKITLSDIFDIYEYRDDYAAMVLQNVKISDVAAAVAALR